MWDSQKNHHNTDHMTRGLVVSISHWLVDNVNKAMCDEASMLPIGQFISQCRQWMSSLASLVLFTSVSIYFEIKFQCGSIWSCCSWGAGSSLQKLNRTLMFTFCTVEVVLTHFQLFYTFYNGIFLCNCQHKMTNATYHKPLHYCTAARPMN